MTTPPDRFPFCHHAPLRGQVTVIILYICLSILLLSGTQYKEAEDIFRARLSIEEEAATAAAAAAAALLEAVPSSTTSTLPASVVPTRPEQTRPKQDTQGLSMALANLAACLVKRGLYAEASLHAQRVSNLSEQALGPEHPDTLKARSNRAAILSFSGDVAGALVQHAAVLDARLRVLGAQHPVTAASQVNCVCVCACVYLFVGLPAWIGVGHILRQHMHAHVSRSQNCFKKHSLSLDATCQTLGDVCMCMMALSLMPTPVLYFPLRLVTDGCTTRWMSTAHLCFDGSCSTGVTATCRTLACEGMTGYGKGAQHERQ